MKKINIPKTLFWLFLVFITLIIIGIVFDSDLIAETMFFLALYFSPVSILVLLTHKFFNREVSSKYFWVVLVLNILLFSLSFLWYHAFDSFMSLS